MQIIAHATLEEARRLLSRLERMSVDSSWARRASGTRGGLIKLIEECETVPGIDPDLQARLDLTVERAYDLLVRAARELRGRSQERTEMPPAPLARGYWVEPGRLLAGFYPGDQDEDIASEKIRALLQAGVTLFLDLTVEGELVPYAGLLAELAPQNHARHIRRPIVDGSVPSRSDLQFTLDILERAMALGECVYVHCWGGRGRTGTVIGTYLVRRGLSGEQALAEIMRLRSRLPEKDRMQPSPETLEQIQLVRCWKD